MDFFKVLPNNFSKENQGRKHQFVGKTSKVKASLPSTIQTDGYFQTIFERRRFAPPPLRHWLVDFRNPNMTTSSFRARLTTSSILTEVGDGDKRPEVLLPFRRRQMVIRTTGIRRRMGNEALRLTVRSSYGCYPCPSKKKKPCAGRQQSQATDLRNSTASSNVWNYSYSCATPKLKSLQKTKKPHLDSDRGRCCFLRTDEDSDVECASVVFAALQRRASMSHWQFEGHFEVRIMMTNGEEMTWKRNLSKERETVRSLKLGSVLSTLLQ